MKTLSLIIVLSPYSWQMVVVDAGRKVNVGTDIGEQGRADADLGWFTLPAHFVIGYRKMFVTTVRLMSSGNTAC